MPKQRSYLSCSQQVTSLIRRQLKIRLKFVMSNYVQMKFILIILVPERSSQLGPALLHHSFEGQHRVDVREPPIHTRTLSHRAGKAGNTKGGSITVPLTSCLTGLESAV